MSLLTMSREGLLSLFPREIPNLDVRVFKEEGYTDMDIFYFQASTREDYLNELEGHLTYGGIGDQAREIGVPDKSKFLLRAHIDVLSQRNADILHILRSPDPKLKGLGAEFYSNVSNYLKNNGFRFITNKPLLDLEDYWQSKGFVHFRDLRIDKVDEIGFPHPSNHVHFLHEEDRAKFIHSYS